MSSQRANSRSICAYTASSACSMPPSVSSENTTPNPNVSSAALRSQTVTSCSGLSWRVSAAKYSPPGPPPMTAIRTAPLPRHPEAAGRLAEHEALDLARGGAGQPGHELDGPRILVGGNPLFHEALQQRLELRAGLVRARQDDKGFHQLPPGLIRHPDDAAFGHGRVRHQRLLDLRAGDVVARGDDHVVAAGLVP